VLCETKPALGKESTAGTSSFPPSIGHDRANKRVSGSDGRDGQQWPLGDALLSALIRAVIIICGRDCREAVRPYLQPSKKHAHSQINDLGRCGGEG